MPPVPAFRLKSNVAPVTAPVVRFAPAGLPPAVVSSDVLEPSVIAPMSITSPEVAMVPLSVTSPPTPVVLMPPL